MTVKLGALGNEAASGYILSEPSRQIGSRVVHRYHLVDKKAETISKAIQAVRQLLQDNPDLIPVFEPKLLEGQGFVREGRYLVINGRAVSLCAQGKGNLGMECADTFFSEAYLDDPIQCSKRHLLERSRFLLWSQKMGKACPAGSHSVEDTEIDPELQHCVRQRVLADQQAKAEKKELERQNKLRDTQSAIQATTLYQLATHGHPSRVVPFIGGGVKVGMKGAALVVAKQVGQKAAKKSVLKFAKKVPLISLFVGLGLGIYRLTQGEWVLAAGEAISGVCACFPGGGTVASIVLDVALLGYDIYENSYGDTELEPTLQHLHMTLGLPYDPVLPPKAEEIRKAHKEMAKALHPDRFRQLGEYTQAQMDELMSLINGVRDRLLQHYNYV